MMRQEPTQTTTGRSRADNAYDSREISLRHTPPTRLDGDRGIHGAYHLRTRQTGTEVTLTADSAALPSPLDTLPLFATLSAETRRRLMAASTIRHYPEGATLFRAGDLPTGIFVVLEGSVRVLRARDGRQSVIHTEGPGGTLAEVPLFEGGTFPGTAQAVVPTRCLLLPGDALTALIRDDPAVALLFLRRLSTRVRGLVERLDRLASQSVMVRVAAFLEMRASAADAETFTLGMTQEELAEELGTVREVIVRALAHLRHDGIIAPAGRGRFAVLDPAALRRLADD